MKGIIAWAVELDGVLKRRYGTDCFMHDTPVLYGTREKARYTKCVGEKVVKVRISKVKGS